MRSLRRALVCAMMIGLTSRASAQEPTRLSLESIAGIDLFKGTGSNDRPNASLDINVVVRLHDGWLVHVRPWFFKSAQADAWNKEIYQAAVQYQRAGRVATRVDAGYIASPIGLGMMDMRGDANPTIRPHLSYFVPLMPFDGRAPKVGPISASYPLGGQLTMSTERWDARVALLGSAPVRRFALHASAPNPRPTPVLVAGGGITPRFGLRLGAAVAAGNYATSEEVADPAAADRHLTMWSLEGEYAWRYSKASAEVTRESFDRGVSNDTAYTWFLQGVQTLSPRWFAAARYEGISAPPFGGRVTSGPRLAYKTVEASAGFRLSPEFTLRGGWFANKWYTAPGYDHQGGVSVVWSRRWW